MIEIWKPIIGCEGYECSNLGRIRSLDRYVECSLKYSKKCLRRGKILKLYKRSKGYLCVKLSVNGTEKSYDVHRIIANTFIKNPNNLPCVNHINEDKSDNRVCNLEWCSYSYNNTFNNRHKKASSKLCVKINQFTLNGEFIKEWPSIVAIQRELGFGQSEIRACCIGKQKTSHGFKWSYVA